MMSDKLMVFENKNQPVALKRRARVLAGRRVAKNLPARTRARRRLHLILKDRQFVVAPGPRPLREQRQTEVCRTSHRVFIVSWRRQR